MNEFIPCESTQAFFNRKHRDRLKKRPCLKCDKPFMTTPEVRLCVQCKESGSRVRAGLFAEKSLLKRKGAE